MNKKLVLVVSICLLFLTFNVSAQVKKTDFSGVWKLDKSKSTMSEHNIIESVTLTIKQTEKQIIVKRDIKEQQLYNQEMEGAIKLEVEGAEKGEVCTFGGASTTRKISGSETEGTVKSKCSFDDKSSLKFVNDTTVLIGGQELSMVANESWELSKDKKTLTISSNMKTLEGTMNSKQVFVKQ